MVTDVADYVHNCDVCQKAQPRNSAASGERGRYPEVSSPFARVAVDFIGRPHQPPAASATGYRYILTIVDHFSLKIGV